MEIESGKARASLESWKSVRSASEAGGMRGPRLWWAESRAKACARPAS